MEIKTPTVAGILILSFLTISCNPNRASVRDHALPAKEIGL